MHTQAALPAVESDCSGQALHADAVVALITLLVVASQTFSFVLDSSTTGGLLESIRAALGLLTATVLVAAYHFALWRRNRVSTVSSPEKPRMIERVILVTGSHPDALVSAITESTGARVTVMRRSEAPESSPSVEQVMAALDGVTSPHVLLVTGSAGHLEVIPLKG